VGSKKIEPKREERIVNEVIVDAYTEEERALSWYYYLEQEMRFPFAAQCVKQWPISPLRKGETIQITALAPQEDCAHQILVLSRWEGRSIGAPLAQLKPIDVDKATAQAIADWHYWLSHENQF
jgi:hypothetical protein